MQASSASASGTALCLNEDSSHYFFTRAGLRLDTARVQSWVDQYRGTQVRELMLNVNAQRTSYGSKVWDPIWKGYEPNGPDDQPLLASTNPASRKSARNWIHTAWQLDQNKLDPYSLWIARARECGLSPWISMRMNDLHEVLDEKSYLHSDFWRQHPQFRRIPGRRRDQRDLAFDFAHHEVRAYTFRLVEELAARYDFDGLELDWMRHGFHFAPGGEQEGTRLLTEFMRETRRLLNTWQRKRNHPLRLAVRVPSRIETALGLGMDALAWADEGLIDMVTITPFWRTLDTDMPVDLWRRLLPRKCLLGAGLELLLTAYPGAKAYSPDPATTKMYQTNSLATVRGAAAAYLHRGAERIYLFNYMDSQTTMEERENYPHLLRETGDLTTLQGKERRHVVTHTDTWAPGEPQGYLLPAKCRPGSWHTFRIAVGPAPLHQRVIARIGIKGPSVDQIKDWEVRVNRQPAAFTGPATPVLPWSDAPVQAFSVPPAAMHAGNAVVEVGARHEASIHWVEIAIGA